MARDMTMPDPTPDPTVLPDARALNTDDARLALWQAIGAIKIGNPTDDKLIVAELAKQGVYLARFATQPASDAPASGAARCGASPDHADIMETIENAADDWQKHGYTSALAEVRDMANVGRALMEALPKGYSYMNCPSEVVADLQNERDEAAAAPKVASEAGAGLRSMLQEAHDTLHECTAVLHADDCRKVAAVMERIRHVLATPTDATDGATGASEAAGLREAAQALVDRFPKEWPDYSPCYDEVTALRKALSPARDGAGS